MLYKHTKTIGKEQPTNHLVQCKPGHFIGPRYTQKHILSKQINADIKIHNKIQISSISNLFYQK